MYRITPQQTTRFIVKTKRKAIKKEIKPTKQGEKGSKTRYKTIDKTRNERPKKPPHEERLESPHRETPRHTRKEGKLLLILAGIWCIVIISLIPLVTADRIDKVLENINKGLRRAHKWVDEKEDKIRGSKR